MIFKVNNNTGKVKSSFMLNPETLTQVKVHAARVHFTISEIMEEALKEYLKAHSKDKTWEEQFRDKIEANMESIAEKRRKERVFENINDF